MSFKHAIAWMLLAPACGSQAADLLEAWQAARQHDARFTAASHALAAGSELAAQGDALLRPQIGVDASAKQLRKDYNAGGALASSKAGVGQQYLAALALRQPLYDRVSEATRSQSHRLADQARVRYLLAEQDLVLRTSKAYFDVLIAQESVSLADAQAEAVSVQLAQAQKMYEIGLSPVTDRDDAQARYDAIQAAGIAARNDLDIKAAAFRRLTGLSAQRLAPVAPHAMERAAEIDSLEMVLARARQESPLVRVQQLGVEMARLEIEKYRLESSPLVSLTASVGPQFDHGGIASSGGRDRTLNASIGLVISVPLYTGGARESRYRQALAQEQEQVSTLEAAQRDAEQLVQQHFLELSNGVARVQALEQARMSAETAVASSKLGREVGLRTVLEVLTVEQAYFQTLYNLVAARYGVLFSRIQLAAVLGDLQESRISEINGWLESSLAGIPQPDGVGGKRGVQ